MSYVPERAAQAFLETHIQKLGYDVAFFEKPDTMCEACLKHPPSLLLLDGRSTTFDIREFLMQLRENQKTNRLPIIIFGETSLSRSDVDFYRQQSIFYFNLPWTASDLAKTLSLAARGKLR
jgi:CheY-like chemotaxis protein